MFDFWRKVKLSDEEEREILREIALAESQSLAEIRVHLARRIKTNPVKDATIVFRKIGMHKTEYRNGIMIYVIPSEHQFAIIGDIGIHSKVHQEFWEETRDMMLPHFKEGHLAQGIISGVRAAGEKLAEYFPSGKGPNSNELKDEISRG